MSCISNIDCVHYYYSKGSWCLLKREPCSAHMSNMICKEQQKHIIISTKKEDNEMV